MYYYFKNCVHRNIHVYTHDLTSDGLDGIYIIAFQTNWSNTWYYLNDETTIGQMTQATKAKRFSVFENAFDHMEEIFSGKDKDKGFTFQGVRMISKET